MALRRFCSSGVSRKVIITGGAGNMGTKAARHLAAIGDEVLVLDPWSPQDPIQGVTYYKADFNRREPGWLKEFEAADAIIHLMAVNPYPGLSWAESAASTELTCNVMTAAADAGVSRFIFASSNHVMGGYKEKGGASGAPLSEDLPVEVGTKQAAAGAWHDSTAYAIAKMAGECIANSLAMRGGPTQWISLRIGWCQPGENVPAQMSIDGGGRHAEVVDDFVRPLSIYPDDSHYDEEEILAWYRNMWLSNRDWCQLAERCVHADLAPGTPNHVVLNANSKNSGSRWDVSRTIHTLGYAPQDDAADH